MVCIFYAQLRVWCNAIACIDRIPLMNLCTYNLQFQFQFNFQKVQLRWTWCNWGAGAAAGVEEAVQSPAPKVTSSLLNCHSLLMMMMMMMFDDFLNHHQHQVLALSMVVRKLKVLKAAGGTFAFQSQCSLPPFADANFVFEREGTWANSLRKK